MPWQYQIQVSAVSVDANDAITNTTDVNRPTSLGRAVRKSKNKYRMMCHQKLLGVTISNLENEGLSACRISTAIRRRMTTATVS